MDRFTQIIIALHISLLVPQVSLCQVPTEAPLQPGVRAQVAVSSIYDGNVLSRPTPTSDWVWRVSPALRAQRKSMRLNISTFCTFDAERFQDHDELSSPLARVTGSIEFTAEPTPRTILVFNGGSTNTLTPADLNVTTGLATDRVRGWEWHGGPEVRRTVTPIVTLGARYQFRSQFSSSVGVKSHEAAIWLTRELSPRHEIRVRSVSELFVFDPGMTIASETVIVGLARRLTDTIAMNLEGGARYILGSIRPEIVAEVAKRAGNRELTLAYAVSHATAFGRPTLVEVQRAQAELAYHPSVRTRAAVQGSVFVNKIGPSSVRVYQLSAFIARPIAGPLSFTIGYTRDLQQGGEDVLLRQDQRIERNALSVSLVLFPLAAR